MTLYSADISKLAVPVKKGAYKKQTKKMKSVEPETNQQTVPVVPVEEPVKKSRKRKAPVKTAEPVAVIEEKPKKKRAPKLKSLPEPEPESEPVIEKKKRVQKAKPKVSEEMEVDEPEPEKPKRKPKVKKEIPVHELSSTIDPPAWFNKYVESVKKEQAQMLEVKVPQKQVKQEAQAAASKSWNDGLTRDRVSNEVDNHMSRMYSMIFKK